MTDTRRSWLLFGCFVAVAVLVAAVAVIAWFAQSLLAALGTIVGAADVERSARLLTQSAVVGLLAMAAIQVARGVYPIRGVFHESMVRKWLRPDGSDAWDGESKTDGFTTLVKLAMARDSSALFDLPLEKLCGQLSAAAERVLDDPKNYRSLLYALVGSDGKKDVDKLLAEDEENEEDDDNDDDKDEDDQDEPRPAVDAGGVALRSGIAHRVQRNIDGLQIMTGVLWKRSLRITAIALSVLLAFGFRGPAISAFDAWAIAFVGILGGFFATVARDVTALIERHRG
jgi:hypothetical protein